MSTASWKNYLLMASLGLLSGGGAKAADAVEEPWQKGGPAFSDDAPLREDKPILLYFTAHWCGFCQQMQRTTLVEPGVLAKMSGVRAYKVDFDAEAGLVKRFNVHGIPAFIVTNDRGEVIDRLTGASPAPDFLAWLTQAETASVTRAKAAAAIAEALRTLPTEVRAADSAVRARALETLWTLAGRAEVSERASATQILNALMSEPGNKLIWRTGLAHTDLAVRVAAANLLRERSSGKQTFDPWANEPERAQALVQLGF